MRVQFNKGYSDKFRSEKVKNYKWYSPPEDSPIEVARAIISEVTYLSILRSYGRNSTVRETGLPR